eukprot:scaffold318_cov332-Ochromonas_danica.AAC.1
MTPSHYFNYSEIAALHPASSITKQYHVQVSIECTVDLHYGQPFDTAFFLYTDLWWDEDLPLLYYYSFLYEEKLGD